MSEDIVRRLREQMEALTEEKRAAVEALEVAAGLGGLRTSLNKLDDPAPILEETAARMRRLVRLSPVCFFLVDEADSSFHLAWCDPPEAAKSMDAEAERLVDDMTFAWALSRNRPVLVSTADGHGRLLLHAMPTASRTRGMCLGRLEQEPGSITDSAHNLLTITMLSAAHELESFELYRRTRTLNEGLEERVALRTEELAAANALLLAEVERRRAAQDELANVNAGLSQLVEEQTRDVVQKAKELVMANKRLRELDTMKSAFISSVSHEMRTPLTSVRGFAKLTAKSFEKDFLPLADSPRLAEKAEQLTESLHIIQDEAERLTMLVDDVLDLSQIESGRMPWREKEVRLEDLLKRAEAAIRRRYPDLPEADIAMRADPGLPPLCIDPDRALQVLANLMDNAVKFAPNGNVKVSGRRLDDGSLKLEVADTGVGIAPENLETVFERFHQRGQDAVDHDRDKPRGTGLGLAITRRILEHYNGSIRAESEPGKGSVFHVTLPPDIFAKPG